MKIEKFEDCLGYIDIVDQTIDIAHKLLPFRNNTYRVELDTFTKIVIHIDCWDVWTKWCQDNRYDLMIEKNLTKNPYDPEFYNLKEFEFLSINWIIEERM